MRYNPNYTILLTEPGVQASNLVASEVSDTQLRITWTRGTGREVLIVARLTASLQTFPQENTTFTPNSVFGSGSEIGVGNYVVYKGTGETVLITGLVASSSYTFYAYEFNYAFLGTEKYKITTATLNPLVQATLPPQIAPSTQATNLVFETDRYASCTAGDGTHRLWLYNTGGAINGSFLPVDNNTYIVGQVLGGGNTVGGVGTASSFIITGLPYATSVAHRVFEYNIASGNPKYNSATATGNPLVQNTITETIRYLFQHPIAQSTRHAFNVQDTSRCASKAYTGSHCETSTEHLLFIVGDNLQGPANEYNYDQTFLRFKSKSDGLTFQEGWQWYADVNGEPIPVLTSGFAEPNGASIQNWLATPIVIADNNIVAYYSYNVGNIGARYGVGRAVSSDGGRTWSRTVTNITAAGSGEDHYQFQQAILDDGDIILFSPNARSGSQGRWTSLRIYRSNDGTTGLNFTKITDDIVLNTDIDVNGFGLFGPPWRTGDRYYWQYTAIPITAYRTTPATSSSKAYEYGAPGLSTLQKQIVLASVEHPITSNSVARIEHIDYETDQQAICSIFPGSKIINHGGQEHILCSCFLWKAEDGTQISIDVRVLSSEPYTGHGAQTIGRNVYPGYYLRLFKMHQTHLDDTYQSTTTQGIEVITNTPLTLGGTGTNPSQFNMNGVLIAAGGNKYPQGATFTHSQTRFAWKMAFSATTAFDSITRGIVEKLGTFKMSLYQGNRIEIAVTGDNGQTRILRMVNTISTYLNRLWIPLTVCRAGCTILPNIGNTDLDIKLNLDYAMDVPMTVIQPATFTQIAQTSNPITFGHVSGGITDHNQFIVSCGIFSGDEVTQQNWLEENCI